MIDPVGTVVTQANAADVDSVFPAGEPVERDGRLPNVDLLRVLDRLGASRDHLMGEWRERDDGAIVEVLTSLMPLGWAGRSGGEDP